jgi:hypothetical protein
MPFVRRSLGRSAMPDPVISDVVVCQVRGLEPAGQAFLGQQPAEGVEMVGPGGLADAPEERFWLSSSG